MIKLDFRFKQKFVFIGVFSQMNVNIDVYVVNILDFGGLVGLLKQVIVNGFWGFIIVNFFIMFSEFFFLQGFVRVLDCFNDV